MNDVTLLKRYLMESGFPGRFVNAVYEACSLLEATNINKDFLLREAGTLENFKAAKDRTNAVWQQEHMDQQLTQKVAQKVLNFMYLMEIRQPGFTTVDRIHMIHDLNLNHTLDSKFLNQVNSDTTPDDAAAILDAAVQHAENKAKTYPDLTPDEETIWNRVKVYHEFPDGFKWVYAVDEHGNMMGYIPSKITFKTMHHCGNQPSAAEGNQYWELRDANGKAYLTIILDRDNNIEESKSWGNQPNKYRRQIQPYVKWFLMNRVNGVGHRYNYGYSTHTNYGVKDFIGDDQEFIDYVLENKPQLIGNTEGKILFWKGALEDGIVTVDQLKRFFIDGTTLDDLGVGIRSYAQGNRFGSYAINNDGFSWMRRGVFGSNPFEVICAVCNGCPFSKEELFQLIRDNKLKLEEFANYDIKLLDDDIQKAFAAASPYNYDTLMQMASEIAAFNVSDDLITAVFDEAERGPGYTKEQWDANFGPNVVNRNYTELSSARSRVSTWGAQMTRATGYLADTNPPDSVHDMAKEHIGKLSDALLASYAIVEKNRGYYHNERKWIENLLRAIGRFSDIDIPESLVRLVREMAIGNMFIKALLEIGRPRIDPIFDGIRPPQMVQLCQDTSTSKTLDARSVMNTADSLSDMIKMFPEVAPSLKRLNPAIKLAMMCRADRDSVDIDEVRRLVDVFLHGDEAHRNKLSAKAGATICALGKFPELWNTIRTEDILWYLMYHSGEIANTEQLGRHGIVTPDLVEKVMTTLLENKDYLKDRARSAVDLVNALLRFTEIPKENKVQFFNYIFYVKPFELDDWQISSDVDIPPEEWDHYTDKMGKGRFIKQYVLCKNWMWIDKEIPSYVIDYVLDALMAYLINGTGNSDDRYSNILYAITSSKQFHTRAFSTVFKKALRERLYAGRDPIDDEAINSLYKDKLILKDDVEQLGRRLMNNHKTTEIGSTQELNRILSNINYLDEGDPLGRAVFALFNYLIDEWREGNQHYDTLVKLAKWCIRNRKKKGVAESIPYDKIYEFINGLDPEWAAEDEELVTALQTMATKCSAVSPQQSLKI